MFLIIFLFFVVGFYIPNSIIMHTQKFSDEIEEYTSEVFCNFLSVHPYGASVSRFNKEKRKTLLSNYIHNGKLYLHPLYFLLSHDFNPIYRLFIYFFSLFFFFFVLCIFRYFTLQVFRLLNIHILSTKLKINNILIETS